MYMCAHVCVHALHVCVSMLSSSLPSQTFSLAGAFAWRTLSCVSVLIWPHPCQHLLLSALFSLAILVSTERYLTVVLTRISLITTDGSASFHRLPGLVSVFLGHTEISRSPISLAGQISPAARLSFTAHTVMVTICLLPTGLSVGVLITVSPVWAQGPAGADC